MSLKQTKHQINEYFIQKMMNNKGSFLFNTRNTEMVNLYVEQNRDAIRKYFDGDIDDIKNQFVSYLDSNPDYWSCSPSSILSNLSMCYILGLNPIEDAGELWLSSFIYKSEGINELIGIIGRNGLIKLMKKFDTSIKEVSTHVVYEGDFYENGIHQKTAEIESIKKNIKCAFVKIERESGISTYEVSWQYYQAYLKDLSNQSYYHTNFPEIMIMYFTLRQYLNSVYIHHHITSCIKQCEKYEHGVPQSIRKFISILEQNKVKL